MSEVYTPVTQPCVGGSVSPWEAPRHTCLHSSSSSASSWCFLVMCTASGVLMFVGTVSNSSSSWLLDFCNLGILVMFGSLSLAEEEENNEALESKNFRIRYIACTDLAWRALSSERPNNRQRVAIGLRFHSLLLESCPRWPTAKLQLCDLDRIKIE